MRYLLVALLASPFLAFSHEPLQVLTFNIRFDNPRDSPNHWLARKEKVATQIRFHEADLVGVQEALVGQVNDLKHLMPGFGFIGVGRDDGKAKGEFSGIFYRTARLELLEEGNFWLSLTPDIPGSRSWDAAITRMVTWGKFKDRSSGKIFFHFNTHFDHMGVEARRESARLLLKMVYQKAGATAVIVTGDFNAKPTEEPIRILTDDGNAHRLLDTEQLSVAGHYGPKGTFNAFGPKETDDQPIDFIFVKDGWKVLRHGTISQAWQGRFASDHFAVIATLEQYL